MIVGGQTEARAQLSSTIIDYHEPFDQGFTKFEAAKTGSGVGFLRLTAVCLWPGPIPEVRDSRTSRHSAHAQSQV